jgi:hypothetical protein
VVDYKKFLKQPEEEIVMVYLGGPTVETVDRRFRVSAEGVEPALLEPGFLRFRVRGRDAVPVGREAGMDLSALPSRTGHHAGGYLATGGTAFERIDLCPGELEVVAPVRARVHAGVLVFDEVRFDTEVEMAVREAVLDGRGIADIKGVAASLRAAAAAALALRSAARLGVAISPNEVRGSIVSIAGAGAAAADAAISAIVTRRREAERQGMAERVAARARVQAARARIDPIAEAERVLTAAGATFRSARFVDQYEIEVRYSFLGERFITLVHAATLNVIDAGICLSGADRELGLDAMPSVIREAIDEDHLNITAR